MRQRNRSFIQIPRSQPFRRVIDRIRRSHFSRLLLMGLLIWCTCFAVSRSADETGNSADQKDISPYRKEIDRFVRLAKEGRINKVSVCYTRWRVQRSIRIHEQALLNSYVKDWEIIAHNRNASNIAKELADTLERWPLTKMSDAHEKYKFGREDITWSELDFGLVAEFFSEGKKVLRIGVSKYPPAISLDGELFFAYPPILVYELASLLPIKAFQDMFSYTIGEWALPPYGKTAGGLRLMPSRNDPNESLLERFMQRVKEESTKKDK